MKRIPFDYKKYLNGMEVVNEKGEKPVSIIHCQKATEAYQKIVCVFEDGTATSHNESGEEIYGRDGKDLYMVPKTKTLWISIRKEISSCGYHSTSDAYLNQVSATGHFQDEKVVQIEVEI